MQNEYWLSVHKYGLFELPNYVSMGLNNLISYTSYSLGLF